MRKTYLMTPGPTPIPESVLAVMSQPIIHHRTPAFQQIFKEVQAGLKEVFQTQQDVLLLASTGTGAMDATVTNLFKKGDIVLTLNAGKFGERWSKICKAYGLTAHELKIEAGRSPSPEQIQAHIAAHPGARAILFQASETSTGARLPTREIAELAQRAGLLSVCDAITACGVFDLPMDSWGIDALLTGSQKAFMLPPGLAMVALSDRAWAANAESDLPRFYFDFAKERKAIETHQTAWTPAVSLIVGLRESLRIMGEEGIPQMFARHARLARATRAGVRALGFELFADLPSDAVTSVRLPASGPASDGKKIVKLMRDDLGVTIVGGQDELDGKILRLSHFGYCGDFDVVTVVAGLELALTRLGHSLELGRGVSAVMKELSK